MPEAAEEPLRIGVDLSCLLARPWTGIGYYTAELMRALFALRDERLRFRVFAAAARPDASAIADLGIPAADLVVARFPTRLRIATTLGLGWPKLERYLGPLDVAHGAFHLLPAARARLRTVTVFDLSAFLHPETRPPGNAALQQRLLEHAIPRASGIITLSESVRREIVERFQVPETRIHIVPGGIRPEEYNAAPEAIEAARKRHTIPEEYLVHLGTLEPRKNLVRLIEAYAIARARGVREPLVLVGARGWMDAPIFDAIARCGVGQYVIHTGYIERAEAIALLCGARACLYPSLYEGFGLPVLEAMAAGTPVLTSAGTAMSEVAGDAAVLVDPQETESIAAGIEEVLEEARARVELGRQRAEAFTWENAAEKFRGQTTKLLQL